MPSPRRQVTRGRIALAVLVVVLFLLVTSLRGLAGFYTDYLWFDSLGFGSVFRTVLGSQVLLVAFFTTVFAAFMWINLFIADRLAPGERPDGPEEELRERYHQTVGRRPVLVRTIVSLLFGLIAGAGTSGQWQNALLFINRREFGIEDPQFGRDVGFYVFQLPFIGFLVSWSFAAILITAVVTTIAHYLNGGIRAQAEDGERVTPQVKAHLSLLLGLLALVKAVGYWFDRFELTLSQRGFVDGASFTDVEAQLPALNLLVLISIFAFGLLVANIWLRGFTWPILAVGLWALVAVVAGSIYPTAIQRFRVEPSESSREAVYIERNIEATRAAMGLDQVTERPFVYDPVVTEADVEANGATLDNVRLLDPGVVRDSFQRLEGVRGFYQFRDVDVARYEIGGETQQVVLSARELESQGLPNRGWESLSIANTHGYGLAVAPANSTTANGEPDFIVSGVPLQSDLQFEVERPQVYYGEGLSGYAVVGAERDEVDYVTADDVTATTRYDGEGGVGIGSLLRRAAFSLRFADFNLLISDQIQGDSRILLNRDVVDRVETVVPFLEFDADPYPALIDGRFVWIVDGYTTTDRYPYAQEADRRQLNNDSGLNRRFNYVRNSAKITVDAYDGDVGIYIIDDDDPLILAYRDIFPALFEDGPIPAELEAQFRYPEDLFRVQTNMWGRYRIGIASDFYDATGAWNVAQDPGNEIGGRNITTETDAAGVARTTDVRIAPQYLLMQLPGRESQEFVLFRPFVPFSEDDTRRELSGFMVANSEPGRYGELEVFEVQAQSLPDGPALFDSELRATDEISRDINLLNQQGSTVVAGNLLLVPLDDSLVYVRPIYLAAAGTTPFPRLQRVIVGIGDSIVMRDTFEEALAAAVAGSAGADVDPSEGGDDLVDEEDTPDFDPDPGTTPDPDPDPDPTPPPGPDATVEELLQAASEAFAAADEALRAGDLATYQARVAEAEALVDQAIALSTADDSAVDASAEESDSA